MADQEYIFNARLAGWRGVSRKIAVRGDQTLIDLHWALQEAFEWEDDHLYSFWLGGEVWARDGSEYTCPIEREPGSRSADVRLDRLGLEVGQRIAYIFDFGDNWEVRLKLAKVGRADELFYPRILDSRGDAPPQYPEWDEEMVESG